MSTRRCFHLTCILLFVAIIVVPTSHTQGVVIPDLKERLEKGLRATQPDHFAFIDQIVSLVDSDQLPIRIVNAAFQWSRKRKPYNPFPYFEKAVRILAEREDIVI